MSKSRKPSWWIPFLIVMILLVVVIAEAIDRDFLPIEPEMEMVTVLVGFGLLALWVNVNRGKLEEHEPQEFTIITVPPRQGNAKNETQSTRQT